MLNNYQTEHRALQIIFNSTYMSHKLKLMWQIYPEETLKVIIVLLSKD